MGIDQILLVFIVLKYGHHMVERVLARVNHVYYSNPTHQKEVCQQLAISDSDFKKTLSYTNDKFRFGTLNQRVGVLVLILFLAAKGPGLVENWATQFAGMFGGGAIIIGLAFFAILGILSSVLELPFEYYNTFVIEEKHGFNKQKIAGFFLDKIKGLMLGVILGGLLLSGILYIMEKMGSSWWLWAWIAMSGFSLFAAWIFPTLLAPIFNKFEPLKEGELKDKINELANKVGFQADGLFVMDASKRSSHGNAYFTGFFKKKRIVLFDTLMESLSNIEIVAVLAHELGHFKLHHVRTMLIRSILMTGVMFYLLSLALPLEQFYHAFGLTGVSNYGALFVFTLWFSLLDAVLQPLNSWMSRKNEFAADRFAKEQIGNPELLCDALLKLRESNHSMPITHPAYSAYYYSHPPLVERLAVLRQ